MQKILFSAGWCNPCKTLKTFAKEQAITFDEIHDIDNEKSTECARKFLVRSVPTTIILKDGKEIDRIIGADINKLMKYKG